MKIAAEMNLSETAFATLDEKDGDFERNTTFGLRWFTPTNEVDLCGHVKKNKLFPPYTLFFSSY